MYITHRVYPTMQGVYFYVTGVYTTESDTEVVKISFFSNFSNYGQIS